MKKMLFPALVILLAPWAGCSSSGGAVQSGGQGGAGGSSQAGGTSGGTGGTSASGGTTSAGGTSASGGVTSNGGASSSGGVTSSGGASGSGGASLTGGSNSSGGTTAAGGSTAAGGKSGSGGATSSGGVTSSGGATGTGGVTVMGGSTANGGATGAGGTTAAGGATATGGSTGSGGSTSTGTGCPGVPIAPDATGHVPINSVGINGNWFYYSDCVDLKNVGCSAQTQPPSTTGFPNTSGNMCTTGTTGTSAKGWGAGIALELNDTGGQQPYNATSHGVKGFCFQLTGTKIPAGTGLRVAFTTKNNNDNPYFEQVLTTGQHTILFTDTGFGQATWETKETWDPTTLILLQFQIPAAPPTAVPWDFCVEGLTAITQ